jgi:hypothetical protein
MPKPTEKCSCGGEYELNRYCGAWVCVECSAHRGLCRCFCGWAADGGDGRAQLVEEGEQIEDDY